MRACGPVDAARSRRTTIDSPDPGSEATAISIDASNPDDLSPAGLCAGCAHHVAQRSARDSVFHRCARADDDERFPRYPPIPVASCTGFERRMETEERKEEKA